jgi:O-antigen/teichoic acid export membrane protein
VYDFGPFALGLFAVPLQAIRKVLRFAFANDGSVGARVFRSGIWVGFSEATIAALGVVRSVALARLLSPDVFGLMALALIVVRAIETFTRPGVAQALIARQTGFDDAAPTAFTMLVGRGVIIAACLAAAAPWIGRFYESDSLGTVLQVLALTFVIGAFANIHTIAKQKELDFRRLSYLAQITSIVGTIVTIAVAWWLRSVWALVIGQLATAAVNATLSYVFVPGRPKFGFDRGIARELMGYGKFIAASSIVLYVATEIDSAVIGKVLGHTELGFYTIAFTVAHLATTNLSKVAAKIMMPAYSKLQSNLPQLRAAYLRTFGFVMLAVLPASALLIVLAEPLLSAVYGEKWLPAAVPLRVLAVFGLLRALAAFAGYLFEGIGKPQLSMYMGVMRLAIIAPLIVPATLQYGLLGAAVTVTIGMGAQWLLGLWFLRKHLDVRLPQLARAMWRPVWTTAIMAALAYGATRIRSDHALLALGATLFCALGVYALLNLRTLAELRNSRKFTP